MNSYLRNRKENMAENTQAKYWGYTGLFDIRAGDKNKFSASYIREFNYALVKAIDMEHHGDVLLEHFATHDPEKGGWSSHIFLTTSNLDAHYVDKNGDIYLDISSCKPFDLSKAEVVIKQFWNPESIRSQMIYRKA